VELDDKVIRTLKVLLVVGGVVLVGGTGLLVWLLARGGPSPAPAAGPRPLPVPAGFRADHVALADGRLLLVGRAGDGRQAVIVADPARPEAARVLLLTPAP
jgi:hypothetical protein